MNRRVLADEWNRALWDPSGRESRRAVVAALGEAISGVGSRAQFSAHLGTGDRAIALTASMGGALAQGASELLDAGNAYAAAALLRQLVEVEYLLWTFADDPDDGPRWIRASKEELWKRFRPSAMRKRSNGRFRANEYATHCDQGGHPSPRGWSLVVDSAYTKDQPRPDPIEVVRMDLAMHLERAWPLLLGACDAIERSSLCSAYVEGVQAAIAAWRAYDGAAITLVGPG